MCVLVVVVLKTTEFVVTRTLFTTETFTLVWHFFHDVRMCRRRSFTTKGKPSLTLTLSHPLHTKLHILFFFHGFMFFCCIVFVFCYSGWIAAQDTRAT